MDIKEEADQQIKKEKEEKMKQMVNQLITRKEEPTQMPVEEQKEDKDEDYDKELNSGDDVSEYEENLDTGRNILLGYFTKCKRKKDKRKIILKHCILRIEDKEYLIPFAKGDFEWVAGKAAKKTY